MPFRRTYRRYNKSRKLSKSNILSNRGAKAQSKQIAALNRKVNYLAKVNRPELRIMYRNVERSFTNSALSSNFLPFQLGPWSGTYTGDDQAAGSLSLEGNFCRCKGISLKLLAIYSDNWRETIADASHDTAAGYRVVILQQKQSTPLSLGSAPSLEISDVFNTQNSLSSGNSNLTLPLTQGITSTYKVLFSKTYTIDRYKPTRQHKIFIPAAKCLNFAKDVSSTTSSASAKGQVWVAILTGGLHYDVDYSAKIDINATLKILFTDN